MKKFKFTLETVYGYKRSLERSHRAALRRAQDELGALLLEDAELDKTFSNTRRSLELALRRRIDMAGELRRHEAYFRHLRELKTELAGRISDAEARVRKCMDTLIHTMREVKAYSKLRDAQYSEYLAELTREEQLETNDTVAFKIVTGDVMLETASI